MDTHEHKTYIYRTTRHKTPDTQATRTQLHGIEHYHIHISKNHPTQTPKNKPPPTTNLWQQKKHIHIKNHIQAHKPAENRIGSSFTFIAPSPEQFKELPPICDQIQLNIKNKTQVIVTQIICSKFTNTRKPPPPQQQQQKKQPPIDPEHTRYHFSVCASRVCVTYASHGDRSSDRQCPICV